MFVVSSLSALIFAVCFCQSKVRVGRIPPGDSIIIQTFHGHAFDCQTPTGEKILTIVVDRTKGKLQQYDIELPKEKETDEGGSAEKEIKEPHKHDEL
mmetsp:Transcript_6642/g.9186  ORF Transcript_6642/g.9186 Transcript_6642/m.9186 type:complete len:97 (-) Transcript_6642:211-501(-)